jgi:AAA15 family ATPase/GTPase
MLNSLLVQNYRNLQELKIPSLSRVNLIIGKNNVGKSSLLEALYLYLHEANSSIINEIVRRRGENWKNDDWQEVVSNADMTEIYASLFYNNDIKNTIRIGQIDNAASFLSVKIVKCYTQKTSSDNGSEFNNIIVLNDGDYIPNDSKVFFGYQTIRANSTTTQHIDGYDNDAFTIKNPICQFVATAAMPQRELNRLWDKISLTPKEESVIEALSIIEPIERLSFKGGYDGFQPKAVVKLKSGGQPVPLGRMGDGMNRILAVALALVNAENGYLLIDEFENGLHYSIQENLWKVIFLLAEKLNVQVFATTHSSDCLKAFNTVINGTDYNNKGQVVSLASKGGRIFAMDYNNQELNVALDHDIEIR